MTRPRRTVRSLSVPPRVPLHEPDLAPEHKAAVVGALRWAWAELQRIDPELARTGKEDRVTARLQLLLNERPRGKRLAPLLDDFDTVTRDESQHTADGRIGKQPDLTFRPVPYRSVTNTTGWGWFVECKVITGARSVVAYRDFGVQRFSSGEYAASMPSAAMLGYVRDGSSPAATLSPALQGHVGTKQVRSGFTTDLAESDHDRSRLSSASIDVTLTHIWLLVA